MHVHANKSRENASPATLSARKKHQDDHTPLLADHRPEIVAQRQISEIANNSLQVQKTAQLQSVIEKSREKQLPIQKKENHTGLPDHLKTNVENMSGFSLDDVKVHYNSAKPAQLSAHAYAQGSDIHIAPGQEKHLPHEAWHVIQQKQGRVKPTLQMKSGVQINDDKGLEKEADDMGSQASRFSPTPQRRGTHTDREIQAKAPYQLAPIQFTLAERLKSGFGWVSAGGGLLTTLALASNPVGWGAAASIGGGLLVGGAISYVRGSDAEVSTTTTDTNAKKKTNKTNNNSKKKIFTSAAKGSTEADWKDTQTDKEKYEKEITDLDTQFRRDITHLKVELRTAYRKLLTLQPLLGTFGTALGSDLDIWRGEFSREKLRTALQRNQAAINVYENFIGLIEVYQDIPALEHPTKKDFQKHHTKDDVLESRKNDVGRRATAIKNIIDAIPNTEQVLTETVAEGEAMKQASRHNVADPGAADAAHVGQQGGAAQWFATRYPNGWVHLIGNAYAAITTAGAGAAPGTSLTMFQDALRNGTINDTGTGESGVKWGKRELKVRRTRLESIQVAGDTRLTGNIQTVTAAVSGLPNDIRVLEFTTVIQAH